MFQILNYTLWSNDKWNINAHQFELHFRFPNNSLIQFCSDGIVSKSTIQKFSFASSQWSRSLSLSQVSTNHSVSDLNHFLLGKCLRIYFNLLYIIIYDYNLILILLINCELNKSDFSTLTWIILKLIQTLKSDFKYYISFMEEQAVIRRLNFAGINNYRFLLL